VAAKYRQGSEVVRSLQILVALLAIGLFTLPASAANQRIIATVADQAVTVRDVDQYLNILKLLGGTAPRKKATEDVINQIIKIEEAKRFKMEATEKDLDQRLESVAKSLKTSDAALEKKLEKQGISMRMMRQYLAAQIAFARLLKFKYKAEFKVDEAAIDAKEKEIRDDLNSQVAKAETDPRRKKVTVYSILEIKFPVDAGEGGASNEMLQSRASEAVQYGRNFKSCKTAKAAAEGIFNVQVGRMLEADASKLPGPLRGLLQSKGPGHAYGPMRAGNALQMVAFCGQRTVTPPKIKVQYPTRAQIKTAIEAEGFDKFEAKYVSEMRKRAIIEYKDQAAAQ
jgi:peptidyl-prolyl cis-trans isomerase SurA